MELGSEKNDVAPLSQSASKEAPLGLQSGRVAEKSITPSSDIAAARAKTKEREPSFTAGAPMGKSVPQHEANLKSAGGVSDSGGPEQQAVAGWRTNALPLVIDSETIRFTNISHDAVTVRWDGADPGLYQWEVLGHRVAWRHEASSWPDDLSAPVPGKQGLIDVLTPAGSASVGTSEAAAVVHVLQPDAGLYYFRVRAWNHAGTTAWSASSYGYWPPEAPRAPVNLLVVPAAISAFAISWGLAETVGTEPCSDISARDVAAGICTTRGAGLHADSYQLEWFDGRGSGSWRPLHVTNATVVLSLEHTTEGVAAAAVAAFAAYEAAEPCPSSVNQHVSNQTNQPNQTNQTVSDCTEATIASMSRGVIWIDFGLAPRLAVSFRVRARNLAGWGDASSVVNATTFGPPGPLAQAPFYAPKISTSAIGLAWWPPPDLGGSPGNPVLGYRVFGQSWKASSSGGGPFTPDGEWVRALRVGGQNQVGTALLTRFRTVCLFVCFFCIVLSLYLATGNVRREWTHRTACRAGIRKLARVLPDSSGGSGATQHCDVRRP